MWLLIFDIIRFILQVYGYLLIAAAILSWVPDMYDTRIGHWLTRFTDPYLNLFRRFIPPLMLGGISLDLAFVVAVIVYFILEREIVIVLIRLVQLWM